MKIVYYLLAFIFTSTLLSCSNKTEEFNTDDDSKQYFPIKINSQWTYQVDSTIYDYSGTVITVKSNIEVEKVISSFTDDSDNINYIVEKKIYNEGSLQHTSLFNYIIEDKKIIKSEDNLKFIELVFPIKTGIYWEGNEFFDSDNTIIYIAGEPIKMYENWNYRYIDDENTFTIDDEEYNNVITVIQTDTENSIERRYSEEKYSKNIGLIYKKMLILNTQKYEETDTPWELKAEEGFILEKKLISYEE
ncbi:MAG: hypothetical protein R2771_04905 [Saprospiraceae bacterium]